MRPFLEGWLPFLLTALCLPVGILHFSESRAQSDSVQLATRLLIDDAHIESMSGLQRVLHSPRRHPENPVLRGDKPWEKWTAEVNGRPVLYDEHSREFRMWYVSPLIDDNAGYGELHRVGYAVSEDGIRWRKPELGQVEWDGSRRNNLIQWGVNWMRRPSVIQDLHDPDPTRRFKMIYSDRIEGMTALVKAYSIDGIHWRLNGDGQPWFRRTHNSDLLGWDPRIERYVHYVRVPGPPTAVGRSTSVDFVTWSEPETVLAPRPDEEGVSFNGLAAWIAHDYYLGIARVRERTGNPAERIYRTEFAFSRDGVHWIRFSPGSSFFAKGEPHEWDSHTIIMPAPVHHDGRYWFFYSGQNHRGGKEGLKKVQEGWEEGGRRMESAVGLATLREDGFVSLDAGDQWGWLLTKPLVIGGGTIEVNADVKGELRVEVVEADGRPVQGFQAEECRPIRADSVRHVISWERQANLEPLKGREVRLRISLKQGSLYSFRFQPFKGQVH